MSNGIKEQYGTFDATIGILDFNHMTGGQLDRSSNSNGMNVIGLNAREHIRHSGSYRLLTGVPWMQTRSRC